LGKERISCKLLAARSKKSKVKKGFTQSRKGERRKAIFFCISGFSKKASAFFATQLGVSWDIRRTVSPAVKTKVPKLLKKPRCSQPTTEHSNNWLAEQERCQPTTEEQARYKSDITTVSPNCAKLLLGEVAYRKFILLKIID
jgi:hypothetical protein